MRRYLVVGVLVSVLVPLLATPASAHDIVYIEAQGDIFVSESDGLGSVVLQRCCHGTSSASVDAVTEGGTATPGEDFTETSTTITFTSAVETASFDVPIVDDETIESIETVGVMVRNPTLNTTLGPSQAMISVIDDDGPSRFSFFRTVIESYENYGRMELVVIRSGDASLAASVGYTTSDGTAESGSDYTTSSGSLSFQPGQRVKRSIIPVTNDRLTEGTEEFAVTLDTPAGGNLSEPSTVTARILDDETPASDTTPPVSYFHQPLHGETYRAGQIRDILAFADDYGTGVKRVHIALMAKKTNGSCAWFGRPQKDFGRGSCSKKVWMRFTTDETVVYRLPQQLRPSRGTKIRFYKAWSRGVDEIGNVETAFDRFRNVSRFEVR